MGDIPLLASPLMVSNTHMSVTRRACLLLVDTITTCERMTHPEIAPLWARLTIEFLYGSSLKKCQLQLILEYIEMIIYQNFLSMYIICGNYSLGTWHSLLGFWVNQCTMKTTTTQIFYLKFFGSVFGLINVK